ncbi:hypothetical protein GGH19_002647 [Coemansia sp. RSA 1807]|nr:hypothetical protein GGH19_002647 [Coemansia sp. RSA 1807]
MYVVVHTESESLHDELKPIVDEFEKELQLKQHLAILLDTSSLPTAQAELITALWKTQPYIQSIINN